jgi:hypothetical protein
MVTTMRTSLRTTLRTSLSTARSARAALTAATLASSVVLACGRFARPEHDFVPDPAPVTEMVPGAGDTTFVLDRRAYVLLSHHRAELWQYRSLDELAWQYEHLFGATPPRSALELVEVGADARSARVVDTVAAWRGIPRTTVAIASRGSAAHSRDRRAAARFDEAGAALPRRAIAKLWLHAAADAVTPAPGAKVSSTRGGSLPSWFEVAATNLLTDPSSGEEFAVALRTQLKRVVSLDSLFAAAVPDAQLAPGPSDSLRVSFTREQPTRQGARSRRLAAGDVLVVAQATSLLAFIHERDPALVAALMRQLVGGGDVTAALAASNTLPHDLAALDREWRRWLRSDRIAQRW